MRWISPFLVVCMSIGIGLFEAVGRPFLQSPWSLIHPMLPMLIYWVSREKPERALLAAPVGGFVFHVFSVEGASFAPIIWSLIVVMCFALMTTIVTNRSLSSAFLLLVAARTIDGVSSTAIQWIYQIRHVEVFTGFQWSEVPFIILWDATLLMAFFIGSSILRRWFVWSAHSTMKIERYGRS